jgi:hypothetical protein
MFLIAAPTALAILYPRTTMTVIGGFGLLFVAAAVRHHRWKSKLPPPTPLRCPKCGSEDLEILSRGLWHGRDAEGRSTGGGFDYALCKKCGSRCAQYVDGNPYLPTEEEWRQHFAPREKRREIAEKWPFIEEEQARGGERNVA